MALQNFKCKCLTPDGSIIHETIRASELEEVKNILTSRSLILVSYKTESEWIQKTKQLSNRPLNLKELISFCDQLFFVFSSGTSLIEGLHIIQKDNKNKKLHSLFQNIYKDVEEGMPLSSSMKKTRNMFPDLLIYMVETGEVSGTLDSIFLEMKDYFSRQQEIKRKVTSALIQPAFLIVFGIAVLIYFLNSILPELMDNLEIEYEQLPLITKFILSLSEITSNYGILLLLGLIGLAIVTAGALKVPKVKYFLHSKLIKIPIFGKVIVYMETFRLTVALSLFLKSDVSIVKSLDIISNLMKNEVARKSVIETKSTLLEGMGLHTGFQKVEFFEDSFVKYIEVGEETGNLEGVAVNLSSQYKIKIDDLIKKSLSLLEPALTIVMAILVGVLVMSIALPIFSMVDYIH